MKKWFLMLVMLFSSQLSNANPLLELSDEDFIRLFSLYADDYQSCIDAWQGSESQFKTVEAKCETMRTNIYFLMANLSRETKKSIFEGGMTIFKDEKVYERFLELIPKNARVYDVSVDNTKEENY